MTPGTNRVLPVRKGEVAGGTLMRDGTTVWLDHEAVDPSQRFKMFVYSREAGQKSGVGSKGEVMTSADGIHWNDPVRVGFKHGDNSSFYHDPFRKRWVYSVRDHGRSPIDPDKSVRARFYLVEPRLPQGRGPRRERPSLWLQADPRDLPDPELGYEPELYDFTAVAYESLMVGVFGIFYGPPNDIGYKEKRPKIIDLQVGFSRDGYHWDRPDRRAVPRLRTHAGDVEPRPISIPRPASASSSATSCTSTSAPGRASRRSSAPTSTPAGAPGWPSSAATGSPRWTPSTRRAP